MAKLRHSTSSGLSRVKVTGKSFYQDKKMMKAELLKD